MAGKSRQKVYKGMTHKRCTKCGKVKPVSDFHRKTRSTDGFVSRCIPCRTEDKKAYYHAHREHDLQKSQEWQRKNKDKVAKRQKDGYAKYPERHIARSIVNEAVQRGKLPRASTLMCANCGKKKAKQYHHYLGYSKEHRLDVIPLCMDCHKG